MALCGTRTSTSDSLKSTFPGHVQIETEWSVCCSLCGNVSMQRPTERPNDRCEVYFPVFFFFVFFCFPSTALLPLAVVAVVVVVIVVRYTTFQRIILLSPIFGVRCTVRQRARLLYTFCVCILKRGYTYNVHAVPLKHADLGCILPKFFKNLAMITVEMVRYFASKPIC